MLPQTLKKVSRRGRKKERKKESEITRLGFLLGRLPFAASPFSPFYGFFLFYLHFSCFCNCS